METNKELVLRLYERKDPKRRRMLFEHYQNLFASTYSVRFLVEIINTDLGSEVICDYDIKYVRSKASKWLSEFSSNSNLDMNQIRQPVIPVEVQKPVKGNWSLDEPKPFTNASKKIKP